MYFRLIVVLTTLLLGSSGAYAEKFKYRIINDAGADILAIYVKDGTVRITKKTPTQIFTEVTLSDGICVSRFRLVSGGRDTLDNSVDFCKSGGVILE